MFQIWEIQQVYLSKALDLAAELMSNAGYKPSTKGRGIVEWREKRDDSGHACHISFKSHMGVLSKGCLVYGYITVEACDCSEKRAFNEIVRSLEREFQKQRWLNEEKLQFLPSHPRRATRR